MLPRLLAMGSERGAVGFIYLFSGRVNHPHPNQLQSLPNQLPNCFRATAVSAFRLLLFLGLGQAPVTYVPTPAGSSARSLQSSEKRTLEEIVSPDVAHLAFCSKYSTIAAISQAKFLGSGNAGHAARCCASLLGTHVLCGC